MTSQAMPVSQDSARYRGLLPSDDNTGEQKNCCLKFFS